MNENKKKELLEKYGEIGVCTKCGDYMVWKKKEHRFYFQSRELIIKDMDFLVCTNTSCGGIGKNAKEYDYLIQKAKRRFYLTGITENEVNFLKNYRD